MFISLASYIKVVANRNTIRDFVVWTARKENKLTPGTSPDDYIKTIGLNPADLDKVVLKADAPLLYEKITGKKDPVKAIKMFETFILKMRPPRGRGKRVIPVELEKPGEPDEEVDLEKLEVKEYEIEKTEPPKGKKPRPDAFLSSDLKRAFGMAGIKALEFGEEKGGLQELKVEFSDGLGKESLKKLIGAGVEGISVRGQGSVWVSSKKLVLSMADAIRHQADVIIALDREAGIINIFKDFLKNINEAMAEKDAQIRMEEYLRKNPTIVSKLEEMADLIETPKPILKAMKLALLGGLLREKLSGISELKELENEAKKLLEEHKELINQIEQQSIEKLMERVIREVKERAVPTV